MCVLVEASVKTLWAVTGVCVSAVTVATAPNAQVSDTHTHFHVMHGFQTFTRGKIK